MTGACVLDPRSFLVAYWLFTRQQAVARFLPEVDPSTIRLGGSMSQPSRPPLEEVRHGAVAAAQRMCVAA